MTFHFFILIMVYIFPLLPLRLISFHNLISRLSLDPSIVFKIIIIIFKKIAIYNIAINYCVCFLTNQTLYSVQEFHSRVCPFVVFNLPSLFSRDRFRVLFVRNVEERPKIVVQLPKWMVVDERKRSQQGCESALHGDYKMLNGLVSMVI